MSKGFNYKDGRVWMQRRKFVNYDLLLPYGMTDVTDPTGSMNAVRQPSASSRGVSDIVDIVRGEPALPGFSLETRLRKTANYLMALRDRRVPGFQAHIGDCGRADDYRTAEMILAWEQVRRGDLGIDRVGMLEGDNSPISISVPFMAEVGPMVLDPNVEFLSQRTTTETMAANAVAFLTDECDDISNQHDPGDYGYMVHDADTGVSANVTYTGDKGDTWSTAGSDPFGTDEDIGDVLVLGTKDNHRVIVTRATTDGSNPAEIAYADVTTWGTITWVTVNVGAVNGQYITSAFAIDWGHIYVGTDDGYIYRSDDGGATWSAVLTTATNQLNAISGLNDGTVWAVGASNTVVFSEDFGDSWTTITGASDGSGDAATACHVTPDGTFYYGNDAGELYGTYDDGDSWTTLSLQGATATAVNAIEGYMNTMITVVGNISGPAGRVWRSLDGGASFSLWDLNMPTNAGLNDVQVINANYFFVCGEPQGGTAFVTRTKTNVIQLFGM